MASAASVKNRHSANSAWWRQARRAANVAETLTEEAAHKVTVGSLSRLMKPNRTSARSRPPLLDCALLEDALDDRDISRIVQLDRVPVERFDLDDRDRHFEIEEAQLFEPFELLQT